MSKKVQIESKRTIWIMLAILILLFIAVILPYYLQFGRFVLSDNPERWGVFGDYIGGTLNVVVGMANLYFLIYISFKLAKIDEDRNNNNYKNSVRPAFSFHCRMIDYKADILFKSFGLGPVIIRNIELIHSDGRTFLSMFSLIESIPTAGLPYFETYCHKFSGLTVGVGEEFTILKVHFITPEDNPDYEKAFKIFNNIIDELEKIKVIINYTDIFDEDILIKEDNIFFGREN